MRFVGLGILLSFSYSICSSLHGQNSREQSLSTLCPQPSLDLYRASNRGGWGKMPYFQADPDAVPEELWEPVGASYYNDELILQPEPCLSQVEQIQLLDWHPMFTGRCPECEMPILQTYPLRSHWDYAGCSWKDDSV